jgi:uncharacterized protein YuzE
MERINLKMGPVIFDYVNYDEEFDILYLRVGGPEPSEAEDTPEGHSIHYAMNTDRIVGLTIMGPRYILEREDKLVVTFPEVVETRSAEDMADLFVAV